MIDLTTYALLRKQITSAASGVSDVRAEGDELVFVLADGHEVRMAIPATEIRDAVVRDDVLVLTLADGKEVVVDATLTQSGQAADAKATGDAVSKLKGDMTAKADKAALARTDRSLDALWKLNQGISYNFETDAAAAYAKQVPSGAKLADVNSIGGHTEAIDGELVSADVESVKYNDAIVAAIPSTVRALPGYGWSAGSVYNSIERTKSGWKYVQRIGSVDLGTLAYDKGVFDNIPYFSTHTIESLIKKPLQYVKANILTKNYETINNGNGVLGLKDKTILVYTNSTIYLRDDSVDTVSSLKAKLSGEMAYFELANPIITDITEAMRDTLEPFDVEGGGAITFENNAKLPVPSSVEYIVSLAEVGA